MLQAIEAVDEMVRGVDLATYRSDMKLRLAVERAIEIISEASRHIPKIEIGRYPDVPWPEIAAIGNKLRHEYQRIDDAIMWKIATRSLPELKAVIVALIGRT
ncbi:MAG: DUF86 domain-containing protein [Hyphomicrobiales bacterium]